MDGPGQLKWAYDLEAVHGRNTGESIADDPALVVGLEIGQIAEDSLHLDERAPGGGHEVINAHRDVAFQQSHQWTEQPGLCRNAGTIFEHPLESAHLSSSSDDVHSFRLSFGYPDVLSGGAVDYNPTINRSTQAIFAVAIPADELDAEPRAWDVIAGCAP